MTDHSGTRLADLRRADLAPQDHIATNFRVYELDRSEVAARLEIDTRLPDDQTLQAAVRLAREVMQPIRSAHDRFSPLSVYRSQALERVLKKRPPDWISLSPHTRGDACDLRIPGLATLELAQWAAAHLPDYDEIRCECVDPTQGPAAGWVHIALRPADEGPGRRQLQSQLRDPRTRRWILLDGLTDQVH